MYLTWLDSNSWLIEIGGKRILLDPWLVGSLVFSNLDWLFQGRRKVERSIPDNIDLILLSQGLEDHAHPPTLKQLDKTIPVVGSPNAAKVAQGLGYIQVTALAHGETFTLNQSVAIKATPGSQIGPTLVENGYLLQDLESGFKLYYEPHGYHPPSLKEEVPVDVIITPLIDLALPVIGPVIRGRENALEVTQWLQPQAIMTTAEGDNIIYQGLLNLLLRSVGSLGEFRSLVEQNNLSTQVIEPTPGERFQLQLKQGL